MAPTTRLAVVVTALLSVLISHVSATDSKLLDFPNCVDTCIKSNGCKDMNSKCICQGAADKLLLQVVVCMRKGCAPEINPKSAVIDVMKAGCSALKIPIPDERIRMAEKLAAEQSSSAAPSSSTTFKSSMPSPSVTTSSGASSQDRGLSSSTASPDTSNLASTPLPESTTTTSGSVEAAKTPIPDWREPTDSSPFATPPPEVAAGARMLPSWWWAAGAVVAIEGLR